MRNIQLPDGEGDRQLEGERSCKIQRASVTNCPPTWLTRRPTRALNQRKVKFFQNFKIIITDTYLLLLKECQRVAMNTYLNYYYKYHKILSNPNLEIAYNIRRTGARLINFSGKNKLTNLVLKGLKFYLIFKIVGFLSSSNFHIIKVMLNVCMFLRIVQSKLCPYVMDLVGNYIFQNIYGEPFAVQ